MRVLLLAGALCGCIGPVVAAETGTPEEARALSERARDAVHQLGKEQAFAAFASTDGGFMDRDLYVFCMGLDGVMLSHPLKPELVGQNLLGFNKYGDYLFQQMVTLAAGQGEGWVDYNWPYPGSDEVRPKTTYIIKNDADFFCGVGAYRPSP